MIPKSAKLSKEEASMATNKTKPLEKSEGSKVNKTLATNKIIIKEVKTLNEFVAVRLFEVESELALPDEKRFKNEGVVVGVGPGIPDGSGGRCASQLALGDTVLVQERNILTYLNVASYPYEDAKIAILSERNIICKLGSVNFEMVD